VTCGGELLRLTAKEFDLLHFLASHPRQVFSRSQLMTRVWGYEAALDTGTLTVHIRRLRAKVERDPATPRHLETVWGVVRFVPITFALLVALVTSQSVLPPRSACARSDRPPAVDRSSCRRAAAPVVLFGWPFHMGTTSDPRRRDGGPGRSPRPRPGRIARRVDHLRDSAAAAETWPPARPK
jgi:hypothetical protein